MSEYSDTILQVDNIDVVYDHVVLTLKELSLKVKRGEMVALLGANGAGKSTTLKAISNLISTERGEITKGAILYNGANIQNILTPKLVENGIIQVMEGRHCFKHLSIEENLLTGAYTRKDGRKNIHKSLEMVYEHFPRLKKFRKKLAGFTSGGEQQMTALGRALMARPKLLLLDEPSMGLAPMLVQEIFEIINTLNKSEGVSILLAEQNTTIALEYSDYGYILENGRVVMQDTSANLKINKDIKNFYLGTSASGKTHNYRDTKHYRRRKSGLI